MSNWKSIDTCYLYDGSFEGLLTIVFDSFTHKTIPSNIVCDSYDVRLFEESLRIETDFTKSDRVYHGIVNKVSYHTLYYAYHTFLSNEKNKEILILRYLILAFEMGNKVDHAIAIPLVFQIQQTSRRVFGEAHRLKGLLRFMEVENNLYYSKIHPDNNVVELLGNHFIQRLPTQNFIIHDQNHDIALLYNTKTYTIVDAKDIKITALSEEEKQYQALWKSFYETIGIKERKNSRLQLQYMPKRYWQDLIEKQL